MHGSEEEAYMVTVEGRVTGVGFRVSAVNEAGRYPGLKGYVRNADARTVECLIQGREPEVKAMLTWLRKGPDSARVLHCTASRVPVTVQLPRFRITW